MLLKISHHYPTNVSLSPLFDCNLEASIYHGGEADEFHVKAADTVEEAGKLIETGFEYVTEMDGKKSCLENASKKLGSRFQNYGVYFVVYVFYVFVFVCRVEYGY